MKIRRRVLLGFITLGVIATLGFVIWAETPLKPAPEALSALQSDSQIRVMVDDYITFKPAHFEPDTALILYPGGRVDYRAYAVPLRRIAEKGYLVVLLPVRLNLAFFDVNAADRALAAHPEIQHWVVGGHSLGGVAAALYASRHAQLDGIVFWASYPSDDALKNGDLKVLSIYGTRDMGGMEQFEASRAKLPPDAQFVVIQGGNHSQFGNYGLQPGDNEATITPLQQQEQVVDATVQFLKELDP
ncbi:MAG TPA: alpha/beta hydrolase [Anaerolineales bacterium]|nr:alpha/beta hydrolase [Anaerolineales bacterium]